MPGDRKGHRLEYFSLLRFRRSVFTDWAGREKRSLDEPLLGRAAYLVCMTAGRESECAKNIFCASTFQFSLMGGWEERSPSVSLLPVAARLVFMPLDRECERAGHLNLLRIHR